MPKTKVQRIERERERRKGGDERVEFISIGERISPRDGDQRREGSVGCEVVLR